MDWIEIVKDWGGLILSALGITGVFLHTCDMTTS